jgi:hypothetical protein
MPRTEGKDILNEMGTKLAEMRLMLSKKADAEGVRKALNYLEKNLKDLFEYLMSNESERDAMAAKRGWNCLSCDRNLLDYQGNIGDYVVW